MFCMLTHHAWLTGVWGAGVPWWILFQHPVRDQTARHQGWRSIILHPLQAAGYPLLPVKDRRQRWAGLKLSRQKHGVGNHGDTCSSPDLCRLLPRSISLALKLMVLMMSVKQISKEEHEDISEYDAHPWEERPAAGHLYLRRSWPRWSCRRRKSYSENWTRKIKHRLICCDSDLCVCGVKLSLYKVVKQETMAS